MPTKECPHASVCNGGYGRLRCTRCDRIVVRTEDGKFVAVQS